MAVFTKDEIKKAIELYFQYNKNLSKVSKILGYPDRRTLKKWIEYYQIENKVFEKSKRRESRYSTDAKKIAVEHFISNGRNLKATIKELGYPKRTSTLRGWIKNIIPEEFSVKNTNKSEIVYNTELTKNKAVIEMMTNKRTVKELAVNYEVSPTTLYNWKKKLLPQSNVEMLKTNVNDDSINELEKLKQEIYNLRLERDILENCIKVLKKERSINLKLLNNKEKTVVIDALRSEYPLNILLRKLEISKSSYFYQKKIENFDKYKDYRKIITQIFIENKSVYGYRRIYFMLKKSHIKLSEKVVLRIMKQEGLKVVRVSKKKYSSYKGEVSPATPNLIKRNFHANKPNQKWLTDITEFQLPKGKVYLSPIIDCYDGYVVSWTIGTSPSAELVNTMLDNAIETLQAGERPICHSDRGVHYRLTGWIERTNKAKIKRSMSKKGCSPDNSACEGFFGRLKNEIYYGYDWSSTNIDSFINILNEYINWYNFKRIKVSLGGISPFEYRQKNGFIA